MRLTVTKAPGPHGFPEDHGTIEMGCGVVTLDKLYGPTAFAKLRVRAAYDAEFCGWIVERDEAGPHDETRWVEVARVEGQKDSDYHCGEVCAECDEMWKSSGDSREPYRRPS